jgi:glutaredoxin
MYKIILILICASLIFSAASISAAETLTSDTKQSLVSKQSQAKIQYPSVVVYTLTTCPHCMEAKQYLDEAKIPYINREVDLDDAHYNELMKIFDQMGVPEIKRGVPLLVIGDKVRLQGFSKERFENAVKEATKGN